LRFVLAVIGKPAALSAASNQSHSVEWRRMSGESPH
jgi:hypothetical protein